MNKLLRFFPYIIIIFSIIVLLDFSNDAGQNIIMIAVMTICPIIMMTNLTKIEKNDIIAFAVLLLLFLSYYIHHESFRLSTILYSGMFIIQFITYKILAKRYIDICSYRKLLVILIYLFFGVLIVQQISRLAHLPEFNSWYYSEFKMNSLAQEPSSLPPTIIIILYSIVKIDEIYLNHNITLKKHFKSNKFLWIAFLYMIFTCGSTTGIFILPIFLLYFYRNHIVKKIPLISISFLLIYYVFSFISPFITERMGVIIEALISLDPIKIYEADPSASARLAPYLIYFKDINFFDINFLFGHGIDYGINYMSLVLRGIEDENRNSGIGGFINFAYDYGFIALILFIVYLRKNIFKFKSFDFIIWFLIFTTKPFNMSLFWVPILLMYTNKLLRNKYMYISDKEFFNHKF